MGRLFEEIRYKSFQNETWATLFGLSQLRAIRKRVHGILIRFDLQKVPRRAYTDDLG